MCPVVIGYSKVCCIETQCWAHHGSQLFLIMLLKAQLPTRFSSRLERSQIQAYYGPILAYTLAERESISGPPRRLEEHAQTTAVLDMYLINYICPLHLHFLGKLFMSKISNVIHITGFLKVRMQSS